MNEKDEGYTEGYKAGYALGYGDGKGVGYSDAKLRFRLALEAACDHLSLAGAQREVFNRAFDNVVGKMS